jgi:hypothetical protein
MKTFNISARFVNNLQELPICVSLLIDGVVLWSKDVLTDESFDINVNDEIKHTHSVVLRFEGKTNVDSETSLTCEYFRVNNYNLDYMLENHSKFYHNFNQLGAWDQIMMFGNVVGIDGELRFELETPVAFWFCKFDKW